MRRDGYSNQSHEARLRKSHAAPKSDGRVTSDVMPDDKFVLLCDWRGHVAWASRTFQQLREGDCIWNYLAAESQLLVKEALSRVVTLRENRVLEIANDRG
jgi:hypothetical protein